MRGTPIEEFAELMDKGSYCAFDMVGIAHQRHDPLLPCLEGNELLGSGLEGPSGSNGNCGWPDLAGRQSALYKSPTLAGLS